MNARGGRRGDLPWRRVGDGKTYAMVDRSDADADRAFREWQARNAISIDPSYA